VVITVGVGASASVVLHGDETHRLIEQHEIHLWAVGAHERACERYALPLRNTLRERVPGQEQKG